MLNKEIIFLSPVFKHNIWGGEKLREDFGYNVEGTDIGECWGVSANENGDCKVRKGRYAGKTLSWLWRERTELFGNMDIDRFPLLIKLIDAKDDLSIQVHPDDAYAKENENGSFGKMECWYVLDCPDDASLVIGHNARDKEELKAMVRGGEWKKFIREIPVKKGDFIQIDPGTVHAIKGGFVILETQQNSDITYRIYDYGRRYKGELRELHIDKSLDVISVPAKSIEGTVRNTSVMKKNVLQELISCQYYKVFWIDLDREITLEQEFPFLIISVIDGEGSVDGCQVKKGDHFILPYNYGTAKFDGRMQMIASVPNNRNKRL